MRKFFYTLGIIAASALAFSACQKEQEVNNEPETTKLVTISFTAEKAGMETRTGIAEEGSSEVSYKWTDEDASNIKLFTVNGSTLTQVANPTITKVSDSKLTISATVAANATYTFRAILAGEWTGSGNNYAERKPKVSDLQSPNGTSSFDPTADILVSDDKEVTVGEESTTTGDMLLVFNRQVVINKMTLKNLTVGEKIDKVVIISDKHLTGYLQGSSMTGDKKSITVDYNDDVVPEGGQFPVYFVTVPNEGQTLTVEVTTDQNIYTKSFATGKTIDFNLGQFTKFNFALPAGVSNTALTLPVEDSMAWATTGGSDATSEMSTSDLTAMQGDMKIYDSATKAYKGGDGIKLGSSSVTGSITTNNINLSSAFYVAIDAKTYGSDASQLKIQVDDIDVFTSTGNLTSSYETYYVNCAAATATSKVTIAITGKRGYINNLVIGAGTYVAPPEIILTSSNPIEVPNTESSQTITYTITNPTSATLSATTDASWITNIDCTTSGSVSFDVDAQEEGAASREATITLAYTGAQSVDVTVSQAAGAGGSSTYAYTFTSKSWTATLEGDPANWTSGKDGAGFNNGGIQVTTSVTGANGTSPYSFTDVEEIVVTYCTNSANGVGSIKVTVGSGTTQTFNVTKPSSGGTTPKTTTFTYSPKESGKVKIEVTCSTNSIYLIGASIKAKSINQPVPHAITCATGIANGSISADKATAYEGDEVTLTATPATGFKLDSWTVTEATSGNSVTVTENKFNMPADAVIVSATFVEDSGGSTDVTFTVGDDSSSTTTLEKNGVTLNTSNGVWNRTDQYRIYSGATLTVSAPSGKNITNIVFTYNQNKFSTNTGNITDAGVWTGTANSVQFSTVGGQVRVTKIVVTYK